MECLEEFDPPVPSSLVFCQQKSIEEFDRECIETTDAALRGLVETLCENPDIYLNTLRRRREDAMNASFLTYMKSWVAKFFGLSKSEADITARFNQQLADVKVEVMQVFAYYLEAKAAPRGGSSGPGGPVSKTTAMKNVVVSRPVLDTSTMPLNSSATDAVSYHQQLDVPMTPPLTTNSKIAVSSPKSSEDIGVTPIPPSTLPLSEHKLLQNRRQPLGHIESIKSTKYKSMAGKYQQDEKGIPSLLRTALRNPNSRKLMKPHTHRSIKRGTASSGRKRNRGNSDNIFFNETLITKFFAARGPSAPSTPIHSDDWSPMAAVCNSPGET